jgi:hypothetical protein
MLHLFLPPAMAVLEGMLSQQSIMKEQRPGIPISLLLQQIFQRLEEYCVGVDEYHLLIIDC